jgi:Cys-tRNA(Pro)/Cys-tRNA(Cys) deacylase
LAGKPARTRTSGRRGAGGGTPAVRAAEAAGIDYTLHPYALPEGGAPAPHGGYGPQVAAALGVPAARLFKTLLAVADDELLVGVVPVSGELDLKALARAAGAKSAVMAEPAVAERTTGYVLGGISPLGQRTRLRTFVDASATAWESIYVSAGRRGLQLELGPAELVRLTSAAVVPIARE